MPELPEVESVRRGLAGLVTGRRVTGVEVRHPRLVRRQPEGPDGFAALLEGAVLEQPRRRGKFLWLPLSGPGAADGPGPGRALVVHLGMSGQLRVLPADEPTDPHTRVVLRLDDGRDLRMVDMRMFGRLEVDDLVPADGPAPAPAGGAATGDAAAGGAATGDAATGGPATATAGVATATGGVDLVPALAAHVARDPLDPRFRAEAVVERLRARRTEVKRALLDQRLVSGVGNIYADESLWRARLHWARRADTLPRARARELLGHVRSVLEAAIADGGTSFDALYVDVNGRSGYYDRSLAVYGREGLPCPACGTAVRRDAWTNRSSFTCPTCQRPPRRPGAGSGGPAAPRGPSGRSSQAVPR